MGTDSRGKRRIGTAADDAPSPPRIDEAVLFTDRSASLMEPASDAQLHHDTQRAVPAAQDSDSCADGAAPSAPPSSLDGCSSCWAEVPKDVMSRVHHFTDIRSRRRIRCAAASRRMRNGSSVTN